MDSGNSGSLQSSSGGDEEYDSRAADSVSAFITGGPPPPYFDPLSNYLNLHQNPSPAPLWPTTRPGPTQIPMNSPTLHTSSAFMPSFQAPAPAAPALQNQNPAAARGSKKRSRASRRAPTTVLTTDTTNFRAMVQEFTGIPAPPFNNSSFPRNRLDLFSTRSAAPPPPPPYLRRPYPQKPHSLLSSSASSSYHLPISQTPNLFTLPNPLLTSFLQSNPKFPFSNPPKFNGLDDQFHSNGLPNLIHSDQIAPQNNHGNNNAPSWDDNNINTVGDGEEKEDGPTFGFPRIFHAGKAPENVESWICSSE